MRMQTRPFHKVPGTPVARVEAGHQARIVSTARDKMASVILEHAILDVIEDEEGQFEEAFAQAQGIIASMAGFRSLRLERCIEDPHRYLLLVEWDRLEDHTEVFRLSPEYGEWRRLLHHFYEPFPSVEHFESLFRILACG